MTTPSSKHGQMVAALAMDDTTPRFLRVAVDSVSAPLDNDRYPRLSWTPVMQTMQRRERAIDAKLNVP